MTAKLQQRPRKRPAHTERGSATRCNVPPPASVASSSCVNPREASWTAVAKRSDDTAFARTVRIQITGKLGQHHPHPSRITHSTRDARPFGARICDPQQRRIPAGAPPQKASTNAERLGPRWQPAAPKQSEGGSAATTLLSPAPNASNHHEPNRPHHSSSVIRHFFRKCPHFT